MRRILIWGFLISTVGCGPRDQAADNTPPNPIRASSLVETYRDFPDRAKGLYTNQVVVVRVLRGHYDVAGAREIHWYTTGNRVKPPAIVFVCRDHQTGDGSQFDLLVAGRCTGRVWDGQDRGGDIKFTVQFHDCSVTRLAVMP